MKKYLTVIFILILTPVFAAGGVFLPRDFNSKNQIIFIVENGEGSRDVAINLQKEGLVWWGPVFRLYVLLTGSAGKLQAGAYSLSQNMNIPQIVKKISSGDVATEKITIIEGWNLKNIAAYLESKGMFNAEEFPPQTDFSQDYSFLNSRPEDAGIEGFLFPDTYQVAVNAQTQDIVRRMLDNFEKKLTPEIRNEIARQNKTIFEIITMASLLEKEVKTKEDKELVSGIFWKRMKLGMPLESCATIAYIKGVDQWRYSYQDTRIDSPYNTYLNYGLPPGPIANPGMDSILAAIYPKSSEYLYYLSTPDDGKTIFSKTLAEHNINKEKYLE